MARGKVAPFTESPKSVCITQELCLESLPEINSTNIQDIPKKHLNPFIFVLNISWMIIGTFQVLFHVYAAQGQGTNKGILVVSLFAFNFFIAIPTFFYLTTLKKILQQLFLLDTLLVATAVSIVAFYNLIEIFDNPPAWQWKAIKTCFILQMVFYVTMIRVMLVCMEWTKWKVVAFKLHLMVNALMYLVCGVYFIIVDFTYTKHRLRKFDQKVHDFMVMFLFGMFGCFYEYFNKISELDFTGMLKYVYVIKNVDENRSVKQKDIMKKRAESIKSFRIIVEEMSLISEQMEQMRKIEEKDEILKGAQSI